jgi:hypothetical protein
MTSPRAYLRAWLEHRRSMRFEVWCGVAQERVFAVPVRGKARCSACGSLVPGSLHHRRHSTFL